MWTDWPSPEGPGMSHMTLESSSGSVRWGEEVSSFGRDVGEERRAGSGRDWW